MRSRWFKNTLKATLVLVTIGLVGFGISFYLDFVNFMRDLYTPGKAAKTVIEHMKANNSNPAQSLQTP